VDVAGDLARRADGASQPPQALPAGRGHGRGLGRVHDRPLGPGAVGAPGALGRRFLARRRGGVAAAPRQPRPSPPLQRRPRRRLHHTRRPNQVQQIMSARFMRTCLLTLAAAITTVAMTAAHAQQPATPAASTLPNGAASVSETYGDWTVDCRLVDRRKQCLLSQVQGNKETGRRVYAIEPTPPAGGKTEGTILMPFGLNLDAGAVLKLDDKDLGKGLRFS